MQHSVSSHQIKLTFTLSYTFTGFIANADGQHPLGGRFDTAARPPRHNAQPQTLHNHLYGPNYYTNGVSTTARPYAATSHVPRSLDYEHGYPVQRFGRQF